MENTSPFLFDNTEEKYFLAVKGKALGPITAQQVFEKIQSGEAGLLHYLWRDGWNDWKRVCDDRDFAVLIPQKPSSNSIQAIRDKLNSRNKKQAPPPSPDDHEARNYYLYFNASQYGPFSKNELVHILSSHKVGRSAYLWMPGWPNWKRLSEISEFSGYLPEVQVIPDLEKPERTRTSKTNSRSAKKEKTRSGKTGRLERTKTSWETKKAEGREEHTIGVRVNADIGEDASDKRRAPRRPLVARLFMHNDKEVIIAVCRDISVGGMQVLTDRIPGPPGSIVKLNVSPGDSAKVKGFVAEGEIVRVLEDGRGFSFRFRKITDETRRAIEKYINSDD